MTVRLPDYRYVSRIWVPDKSTFEMVDRRTAYAREEVLRERIKELEGGRGLIHQELSYWYEQSKEKQERCEKLEKENEELKKVQEDLIKRAIERILDETT